MISEADKNVAEYFEKMLRRSFEAGDKPTLLWTIYACLDLGRAIPEWLRVAFLNAYEAAERFEIRSWDQVFGRPVPKGLHLQTKRRNAQLRWTIIERVETLKAKHRVDKGLFEKVARDLKIRGVKGTTVSEIYYDEQNRELRKIFRDLLKNPGITDSAPCVRVSRRVEQSSADGAHVKRWRSTDSSRQTILEAITLVKRQRG
jgi:hypothetical protein